MVSRDILINLLLSEGFVVIGATPKIQMFKKESAHLCVHVSRDPMLDNNYIRQVFRQANFDNVDNFINTYSK